MLDSVTGNGYYEVTNNKQGKKMISIEKSFNEYRVVTINDKSSFVWVERFATLEEAKQFAISNGYSISEIDSAWL